MPEYRNFDHLLAMLRQGDADAAAEVFKQSQQRLLSLARKKLHPSFRSKLDPEDIVQSVYKTFFDGCSGGKFDLGSWDHMWATLTLMTVRKCRNKIEQFRAACRDVRREERSISSSHDLPRNAKLEPTVSEVVMLAEAIEHLTRGLDEREREVVALTLQGFTVPEISSRLGRPERTVRREVARLKARALSVQGADVGAANRHQTLHGRLRWPGGRQANCRCGYSLSFWLTPWGYKSMCPKCGAMVGLCLEKIEPDLRSLATHAVATCACGTRIILLASDAGQTKCCPTCGQNWHVPGISSSEEEKGDEAAKSG